MKKAFSVLAAFAVLMTGCSGSLGGDVAPVPELTGDISGDNTDDTTDTESAESPTPTSAPVPTQTTPAVVQNLAALTPGKADTDTEWDKDAVTLEFDGTGVVPSSTEGVTVAGGTLTITKGGTYVLSGTLDDGRVVVNLADKSEKVHLIFNGVSLTCKTGSPLTILQADKTVITLAEGTENSLTDGAVYTTFDTEDEEGSYPNSCLSSKDDLTINGTGSLKITANANSGIHCADDLKIISGNVTVQALNHGLRGNDSVQIFGGTLNITAGSDGIKSTTADNEEKGFVLLAGGTAAINAGGDGVSAATVLSVTAGDYTIVSGGGSANAEEHIDSGFPGGGFPGGSFGDSDSGNRPDGDRSSEKGQDGEKKGRGGRGNRGGGNDTNSQNAPTAEFTANFTAQAAETTSDSNETKSGKGLKAGTYLCVTGGSITADTADDALHSNGDAAITAGVLNISAGDDGIHAENSISIGTENAGTFDDVQIYISKAYEGVEAAYIYQNSGTVYVVSTDDGYNAGGAEISESSSSAHRTMESSYGELYLRGGLVCVNSASGDHDGMDSNGPIYMSGGYYVCNGWESLDCGENYSFTRTGGSYITMNGGNTSLNVRYTFADEAGNVICSVMSANGNIGQCTDDGCKAYYGGTLTGGTELLPGCPGGITTGGKLTDGKEITAAASEVGSMMGGFGRGGGRGGMTSPNGEFPESFDGQLPDGFTPPDGFDGDFTPPDGFTPGKRGGENNSTDSN